MEKGIGLPAKFFFIIIIASLLFPVACSSNTPVGWRTLREDGTWMNQVDQYLGLSYVETSDQAAFTVISASSLEPSLYSTYSSVRILTTLGIPISDPARIIDYVRSLRRQDGSYSGTARQILPAEDIYRALRTITELGGQPQDIDQTVSYLLSLEDKDGTFRAGSAANSSTLDDTELKRVSFSTPPVVTSLILLGKADKIPTMTKEAIESAIQTWLGQTGPFPALGQPDTSHLISAIKMQAEIDPALVGSRAKAFIRYALEGLPNLKPDIFIVPPLANDILDTARLLGITESSEKIAFANLRQYVKADLFHLQNPRGGFGQSDTIEPLSTSYIVALAARLGVDYPHEQVLLANLDLHRVPDGWAFFYQLAIDHSTIISTYFSIEVADFSGFVYNHEKVAAFLRQFFQGGSSGTGNETLQDLYYSVTAFKKIHGSLSQRDKSEIEATCLQLARRLANSTGSPVDSQFSYAVLISQEVGFQLPEDVMNKLHLLAASYKADLLNGQLSIVPQSLSVLHAAAGENGPVDFSDSDIKGYLNRLYDANTGGYSMTPDGQSPELYQTYMAIDLLHAIGGTVPNPEETYRFVMDCRRDYGFARTPTSKDPNMIGTFAALMILAKL